MADENTKVIKVWRISEEESYKDEIAVIKEVPLTIFLNGKEIVTLLTTGTNFKYLAIGFLNSEGLLNRGELKSVYVDEKNSIVRVEGDTSTEFVEKLMEKRTITSGCGKGTIFYNVLDSLSCKKIDSKLTVSAKQVLNLMRNMQERSALYKKTHGVHNAALCSPDKILIFREDIGRHNAIDKINGECFLKDINVSDKIILTTGRISSEILIKTGKMGIPIIVSRSTPTDLSLSVAEKIGMTVIGYARGRKMIVYTHEYRVKDDY